MSRHNINYFDESTERSEGSRTSSTPFLSFPSPVFPMVSTIVTGGRHPQRRKLFRNVFRRQSQESMLGSSAALPSFDQPPQDDEKIDNVSMAPSPHTHPLLARPVARSEAIQGHLQVAIAKGITPRASDAQFAAARRDAERVRGATTDPSPVRLRLDSEETHGRPATARDVYTRTLREREMTALNAAAETRYIREWGFFLKCYAEVRRNL